MHDKINLKILQLLRKNHITQKKLAKTLKMDEAVISRWISGKSTPSLKSIQKIAKALNISVEDLLNETKNFSDVNVSFFNSGKNQQVINKNSLIEAVEILKEKLKVKDEKIKFLEEKIKFLESKKK